VPLTLTDLTAGPAIGASTLAIGVPAGGTAPAESGVQLDDGYLRARGFEGKSGEVLAMPSDDGGVVLAVGLGKPEELTTKQLRRAAAQVVRQAGRATSVDIDLLRSLPAGVTLAAASQAVAEGAALASYAYTTWRSSPKPPTLTEVRVVGGDEGAVAAGQRLAAATALARDLVNEPPSEMAPTRLAEIASQVCADAGVAVEVWDADRLREERCGGILGVSAGSVEEGRLVRMTYEPASADATTPIVYLVGKGITFDSGGLSIKPAAGMMTMKTDMGGAAAVIATLAACPALAVPVRVVGIVCSAENMPGPAAIKPGDVLRFRNGKTAEVLNTDAEGRLVLADGLSLAAEAAPAAVIDVATLTGACVVALGNGVTGVFSNDDDLAARVVAAGDVAGEPAWRMPVVDDYRKLLDSEVADMKNVGPAPPGGAITAALFLREFVGSTPWAHMDIAGPSRVDSDDAEMSKGGTGTAARTLLTLLQDWTALR
jgi:leucyl aminopeptidase